MSQLQPLANVIGNGIRELEITSRTTTTPENAAHWRDKELLQRRSRRSVLLRHHRRITTTTFARLSSRYHNDYEKVRNKIKVLNQAKGRKWKRKEITTIKQRIDAKDTYSPSSSAGRPKPALLMRFKGGVYVDKWLINIDQRNLQNPPEN